MKLFVEILWICLLDALSTINDVNGALVSGMPAMLCFRMLTSISSGFGSIGIVNINADSIRGNTIFTILFLFGFLLRKHWVSLNIIITHIKFLRRDELLPIIFPQQTFNFPIFSSKHSNNFVFPLHRYLIS